MSAVFRVPAFRVSIDERWGYACKMTCLQVATHVRYRHELIHNSELKGFCESSLSHDAGLVGFLVNAPDRFLPALVVTLQGGHPEYTPLHIEDPSGIFAGLVDQLGVLTFDGTQAYFVLDGQHRLRAIKDAIKLNPELGKEDICVLIVTHYDNSDGRMRTRRLFSNINRNAKQTGAAENIALDEDDGFAILARRLLDDHDFLKEDGRVKVIVHAGEEGELTLAKGTVPKTDPRAWTTLTVLYDMLKYLGYDLAGAMRIASARPADEVLDGSYSTLAGRIDDLLKHCGEVRPRLEDAASAREVRSPKDAEGEGHPFMRPVVQKAVCRVAAEIMKQGILAWPDLMTRLGELPWRMASPPWEAVFNAERGTMQTGKEFTELLCDLLHAHLAPVSLQSIKRARKAFKDLKNKQYPISEEELATRLPKEDTPPVNEVRLEVPELSEDSVTPTGSESTTPATPAEG